MIENNFDSKVYIGSTIHPIEMRFKQHVNAAKNPVCVFHIFMKQHDPKNFFITNLHTVKNVTIRNLHAIEKIFIEDFGELNTVHNRMELPDDLKQIVEDKKRVRPEKIFEYEYPEITLDYILDITKDCERVLKLRELIELALPDDKNIGKILQDFQSEDGKCVVVTSQTMNWLGYENVHERYNKSHFIELLKAHNISFTQMKHKHPEFQKYPELVEEAKNLIPNSLNKKMWIVMGSKDFKRMVMCLRTKRANQIRNYYLTIEDLNAVYDEYVNLKC